MPIYSVVIIALLGEISAATMVFFNGSMKLKICEASDLKPTDFSLRLNMGKGKGKNMQLIDPYVSVDVDELNVARTSTKQKTFRPSWNEEFTSEIHNGQMIGITVFHDAAIPPDEFVANCSVAFEDIVAQQKNDFWVSIVYETDVLKWEINA